MRRLGSGNVRVPVFSHLEGLCHVYVDKAFMDKVGEQQEMEKSMLDFAENVQENSRLSCQITVSDSLDGLRVTTPESQH